MTVAGHRTSVSLEDPFWGALREIADGQGRSLAALVAKIDAAREGQSLSSALRLHVLAHYQDLAALKGAARFPQSDRLEAPHPSDP